MLLHKNACHSFSRKAFPSTQSYLQHAIEFADALPILLATSAIIRLHGTIRLSSSFRVINFRKISSIINLLRLADVVWETTTCHSCSSTPQIRKYILSTLSSSAKFEIMLTVLSSSELQRPSEMVYLMLDLRISWDKL